MNGAFQNEPADPLGEGAWQIFMRQLKRWIRQYLVLDIKGAKRCPQPNGGVVWVVNQPPAQAVPAGGWRFQKPKIELDVTRAVTAGTVVYISPDNPLAAGSYTDLVSNIVINARSGLWVCVQSVPATVAVSGVNYYNIPQIPYPGATGGSFGSHPWTGDLDGANVFWAFLAQTPVYYPRATPIPAIALANVSASA